MNHSRLLHLAGIPLTEAEKKHYIVSNGSRVAGPFDTEKEADAELLKRQKRAKPEDEFDDAKIVCEAKASSLNATEKKFAAAVREFFLSTLKDKIGNPDNGMDVLGQFEDEWNDLPHAIDAVVRSVLKSEKSSVRKALKEGQETTGEQLDEAVTAAKVRAAEDRAGRAELAVETEQKKSGYGKSNDKVRELKAKAQKLRGEASSLARELKQATK